ncbi:hypothetical protein [Sphingomonas sp.]|uniref:hypothetical protein n=1 Tax=Sphingomonas sp. TaxID=28214 RepID=UPI0025CDA058|nr:hypothetical protein [Sphingomonas sp.]MBV9527306.1 hypothetical protein [Sphingomonas sp.]
MSRLSKKTVELNAAARPSRIRRDPVRAEERKLVIKGVDFHSREWEIALGIIGIVLFALALNVIWFGFSAWLGR